MRQRRQQAYIRHTGRRNSPDNILFYLLFPVSILYMEIVLRLYCFDTFWGIELLYILLFSAAAGLFMLFISSLFTGKALRVAFSVILFVITFTFGAQAVYYNLFKTFLTLYSVGEANQVLGEFWKEALLGIWKTLIPLIFIFIPFILWMIFKKKIAPEGRPDKQAYITIIALAIILQIVPTLIISNSSSGIMPASYIYSDAFMVSLSVPKFGVMTTLRLDIKNLLRDAFGIFNNNSAAVSPTATPESAPPGETENGAEPGGTDRSPPPPTETIYEDNVLEIDFDALIAAETDSTVIDMHEYFKNVEPTGKSEYTGMFEGKNLIWIVGEAFSGWAVDKELTPTLYKLANEGFVFTDFYVPVWGVSTSDGEYTTMTGLIPKSGVWSFSKSSENSMPFGFGTMFSSLGYKSLAYHNHTYTYYDRHLSHPNMGYDFKGVGNGLEMTEQWPESDIEMMEVTIPEYIDDQPFHIYYMTVSGHLNYNFNGNMMAYKNREAVDDLEYSDAVKAYLACNIELDKAMEYLLEQLEEAGIAEDTVIVLSGDHYPYGLENEEISELAGHEIETNFELYQSALILWSGSMEEPVVIDEPCSSLDIMPTLANLFGLEYDSRLIMGRDILSDSDPLVIFSNRSFITELGRYNSATNTFTPDEGVEVPQGYASRIFKIISDRFSYSAKILENDYYAKVLGDQ